MEAVKHDGDKVRMELLPPELLTGVGEILTYGAIKYGARNWEKGMEWSRVYGALLRHLNAWWGGEEVDPETNMSHLWHAGCNIAFLIAYEARSIGDDDRPLPGLVASVEGLAAQVDKALQSELFSQTVSDVMGGRAPQDRAAKARAMGYSEAEIDAAEKVVQSADKPGGVFDRKVPRFEQGQGDVGKGERQARTYVTHLGPDDMR